MKIGEEFINNNGMLCYVKEVIPCRGVLVEFLDGETLLTRQDSLKNGKFRKPSDKRVSGVGLNDLNLPVSDYLYKRWKLMINRCYSEKYIGRNSCYENVTVCDDWLKISGYVDSLKRMFNFDKLQDNSYVIDKDILCNGAKIYSEQTCCIIPKEINNLIVRPMKTKGEFPTGVNFRLDLGRYASRVSKNNSRQHLGIFDTSEEAFQAYKTAKEVHIKAVVEKWKGKIDDKVYEALMNWEIGIDD